MEVKTIEGYPEWQRDTDKIKRDFPKIMHEADLEIARDWLSAAVGNASTAQESLAAQSLTMNDLGDSVSLEADSPLFFGSEFGGQGRPTTMHFPPHNGREGYWFYPARRENDDHFNDLWDKAIEQAMKPWDHKEL